MKFRGGMLAVIPVFALFMAGGNSSAAVMTNSLGSLPASSTLSGTLASESDVELESFNLSSPTALTVFTTSYGGGKNLNGTTTAAGGFQPNVSLFDMSGSTIAQTSGSNPMGTPVNGIIGDSYFMTSDLTAGSYLLAVTNWATTGDPVSGFTDSLGLGSFTDVNGNVRNGNFTVNISAATTATPEPASFWMSLIAFAGAIGSVRIWRVKAQRS